MGYVLGLFIGVIWGVVSVYSNINADTVSKVSSICNSNKGLKEITVDVFELKVYCNDGARFKIKD